MSKIDDVEIIFWSNIFYFRQFFFFTILFFNIFVNVSRRVFKKKIRVLLLYFCLMTRISTIIFFDSLFSFSLFDDIFSIRIILIWAKICDFCSRKHYNWSFVIDIKSCVEIRLLKIFVIKNCFDDCLLNMNMNLRSIW